MRRFATVVAVVLVAVFGMSDVFAQGLGFMGVGGRLGYAKPSDFDGSIAFGAHVHLGEIIENLVLMPNVDYFSKDEVSFLSVNGNVRYYFPTEGAVDLFAGGGLGFVRVSVDLGQFGGDVSETEIGLNLLGGADFAVAENIAITGQVIYVTEGEQIKVLGGVTYFLSQ